MELEVGLQRPQQQRREPRLLEPYLCELRRLLRLHCQQPEALPYVSFPILGGNTQSGM